MIYELRTYTFKAGRLQDFIAAFEAEALPVLALRLRGFWRSESGVLNRAIHLWEHEDRQDRTRIRDQNAPDLANFASKVLPMMRKQHSLVCGGEVNLRDAVPTSVFDLVSAKGAGLDDADIGELCSTITAWLSQYFHVAANLRGEGIGDRNLVWLLRANSLTLRDHAWRAAMATRPELSAPARKLHLESDLLLPAPFSPLH
jgi:NIPSNAP